MAGAYGYTVGQVVFDRAGEPGRLLQIDTTKRRLRVAWRSCGTTWIDLPDLAPSLAERQDRRA